YLLELQNKLAKHLDIQSCSIVPGNFDKDYRILSKMAERTIEVINHLLGEGEQIIAVMGGTTLNEVANHMDAKLGYTLALLCVPARGELAEEVMMAANASCQRMAQPTRGQSHGLYAQEQLHSRTYENLLKAPEIEKTIQIVQRASLFWY